MTAPRLVPFLEERLSIAPLFAEITSAKDGTEALKLVLEERFDCLVCDLRMPGLDGFALLRQIRQRFSLLQLPVLILTAAERTQDKVAGFAAGASDFLVKPIAEDELIARVQTHVTLSRMHQQLLKLVETDPLTGCGNRRMFMGALEREMGRSTRSESGFGLLLLDVDHSSIMFCKRSTS
ncbi:MAG: response regulator [Deltaproteobacteria bacterium]|nr:response regulator [Deltaproteobacteria bacterium]